MNDPVIEPAGLADLPDILALQKLAFRREAERYGYFRMQPMIQTLEDVEAEFQTTAVLKAAVDGRIVGAVRAEQKASTCFIGKLAVHPDFQRRGIATRIMGRIEEVFPATRRFELFTGCLSHDNIRLYRKLGYRPFGIRRINDKLSFVLMEKIR